MAGHIYSQYGDCVYARDSYPLLPVLSAAAMRQVANLMSSAPVRIFSALQLLWPSWPIVVLILFVLICGPRYTLPAGPPGNMGAGRQENNTYVHCLQFLSGPDDHCSAACNEDPG